MKKYLVEITETLQRNIEIEANSGEEAIKKVKEMYANQEVVLDSNDYIDNNFEVFVNEDEDKNIEEITGRNVNISELEIEDYDLITESNVNISGFEDFKLWYMTKKDTQVFVYEDFTMLFVNKKLKKAILVEHYDSRDLESIIFEVLNNDKYFGEDVRVCSKCGEIIEEGYYNGGDYLCEKCIHEEITEKEWNDLCKNYEDEHYWTTWND